MSARTINHDGRRRDHRVGPRQCVLLSLLEKSGLSVRLRSHSLRRTSRVRVRALRHIRPRERRASARRSELPSVRRGGDSKPFVVADPSPKLRYFRCERCGLSGQSATSTVHEQLPRQRAEVIKRQPTDSCSVDEAGQGVVAGAGIPLAYSSQRVAAFSSGPTGRHGTDCRYSYTARSQRSVPCR